MGTAESLLYYDDEEGAEQQHRHGQHVVDQQQQVARAAARALSHPGSSSSSSRPSARPPERTGPRRIPPQLQQHQSSTDGRQNLQEQQHQQEAPLTLRGIVLGSSNSGKTCLVRRLRGEDPYTTERNSVGSSKQKRRRKMMALVPWKSKTSGEPCQLHVVEKGSTMARNASSSDDDESLSAQDAAVAALSDSPDFCIVMVNLRDDSSVKYARDTVEALLNAPLASSSSLRGGGSGGARSRSRNGEKGASWRPCICVLLNCIDLVKVVEDGTSDESSNDGLFRTTKSHLQSVAETFTSFNDELSHHNDDENVVSIPPSVQVYPASMLTCSGLPSLHSFVSLPYLRRKESRLLYELKQVRENHDDAAASLRAGAVNAMKQAIDEAELRMSTVPPVSIGRRSIIPRQDDRGLRRNDTPTAAMVEAASEKRVRIDETRNTSHFEEHEPKYQQTSLPHQHRIPVKDTDIDNMTQRLGEADRLRRSRLSGTKALEESGRAGKERTTAREGDATSKRGRRSIDSTKQRAAMKETMSQLPRQQKKASKSRVDDPATALEAFLGDDDKDANLSDYGQSYSGDRDSGARASLLLSDSDSEDDDFYYDETGHAHYSHLDKREENQVSNKDGKERDDKYIEHSDSRKASDDESDTKAPQTKDVASDKVATRGKNEAADSVEEEDTPSADKRNIQTKLATEHGRKASFKPEEEKKDELLPATTTVEEMQSDSVSERAVEREPVEERTREAFNSDVVSDIHFVKEGKFEVDNSLRAPEDPRRGDTQNDDAVIDEYESDDGESPIAVLHSDDDEDGIVESSAAIKEYSRADISASEFGQRDVQGVSESDDGAVGVLDSERDESEVEVLPSGDEENDDEPRHPGNAEILESEDELEYSPASRTSEGFHIAGEDQSPPTVEVETLHSDKDEDSLASRNNEILHSDEEDNSPAPTTKISDGQHMTRVDNDYVGHTPAQQPSNDDAIASTNDGTRPSNHDQSNTPTTDETRTSPSDAEQGPEPEPELKVSESSDGMSAAALAAIAAAQEEAIRMMSGATHGEERRKKKSSKKGRKNKKSKRSEDGEKRKKKKSSTKRSAATLTAIGTIVDGIDG